MHWFEFALRDFMNIERLSSPTSVIVFDDMLPRSVEEAARDRVTKFWAGDVFKMQAVLRSYRPDLIAIPVDTVPTGLLIVLRPDARSHELRDRYDAIVADAIRPDPQAVPEAITERRDAVAPDALLASDVWSAIISAREIDGSARAPELEVALRSLDGLAPRTSRPARTRLTSRPGPSSRHVSWRARRDSNPRPLGPQPNALSTELRAHAMPSEGWRRGRDSNPRCRLPHMAV